MLVGLKEAMLEARKDNAALAAFNVPNLEMLRAAVQAAEELQKPVILQHAEGHGSLIPLEEIGPIMVDYAKRSSVPIVVHLDHGNSLQAILKAIQLGFTSVMIDASSESYEKNVRKTKEIVTIAHSVGVDVEAELGHVFTSSVGGGEGRELDDDQVGENEIIYTDPEQAKQFVEATGIDCLAVAFGTVHGVYLKEPQLDLPRVKEIYQKIGIPLVMHGGSGIDEEDYRTAISNGVTKINYYTYANKIAGNALKSWAEGKDQKEFFLEDAVEVATQSLKNEYRQAMKMFLNN